MFSSDRLRHARQLALAVALVLLGSRLISLYIVPAWQTIVTDFPNYYVSAWAVRHGEPLTELYNPLWFDWEKRRAGIDRPAALFNYFPPMNALIVWPLAGLSPIAAKRAWTVVNIIALLESRAGRPISSGRWPCFWLYWRVMRSAIISLTDSFTLCSPC